MKQTTMLGPALALGLGLCASDAQAVTYNFSFTDGTDVVSGTIANLPDNFTPADKDTAPLGVVITVVSAPAYIGLTTPAVFDTFLHEMIAMANGVLTAIDVDVNAHSGGFNFGINDPTILGGTYATWLESQSTKDAIFANASGVTLTNADTPTDAPEPTTLGLLAAGMVGLRAARRR